MKTNKNLIGAISLILLLSSVIGCANDSVTESTTTDAVTDTAATETAAAEPTFLDSVPDASYFEGEEFHVGWAQQYDVNEISYTLEEAEGDSINEAVYQRNLLTEERLGIKISSERIGTWVEIPSQVAKLVQADEDIYDAFCMSTVQTFNCVLQGYMHEISSLDSINVENPWWDTEAILDMYSLGTENVYFVSGDINYEDDYSLAAILFNKRLCTDHDIQPYEDVRNGTWTLDTFHRYLAEFGSDIDGDGKFTGADMYGVTGSTGSPSFFISGAGEHLVLFDAEGNAYLNDGERFFDVANKMLDALLDRNSGRYCVVDANSDIGWDIGGTLFPNAHAAFAQETINAVMNLRFSMQDDFGILPLPKYDDAQESYHSPLGTTAATVYSIPVSCDDPTKIAWIFDVMGYYSTDTLRYAAMDKVLRGKTLRDDESEDMLNLIFDNKFYDLGFWSSDIYSQLGLMVQTYTNTVVSTIEKSQSVTRSQYETVKEYYKFK